MRKYVQDNLDVNDVHYYLGYPTKTVFDWCIQTRFYEQSCIWNHLDKVVTFQQFMTYFEPLLSFTPDEYIIPESLHKEIAEYQHRTRSHPFYSIAGRLQMLIDKDTQAGFTSSVPFDINKITDALEQMYQSETYDPTEIQYYVMSSVYAERWGYIEVPPEGVNELSKLKLERAKQCRDIADAFIEEEAQHVKDTTRLKELLQTKDRELYKQIRQANIKDEHDRKLEYILFLWRQWFKWCKLPDVDLLDTYLIPLPIHEYMWTPSQRKQLELIYANPEQANRYHDVTLNNIKELCSFAVIPPMWICEILQAFQISDEIVLICRDRPENYIDYISRLGEEEMIKYRKAIEEEKLDIAYTTRNLAAHYDRLAWHFKFRQIPIDEEWEKRYEEYEQSVPHGYTGSNNLFNMLYNLAQQGVNTFEDLSDEEKIGDHYKFVQYITSNYDEDTQAILTVHHWFLSVRSNPALNTDNWSWSVVRKHIQTLSNDTFRADDIELLNDSLLYGYLFGVFGPSKLSVTDANEHFYWDVVCVGDRNPIPGKAIVETEFATMMHDVQYVNTGWSYHRRFIDTEPLLSRNNQPIYPMVLRSKNASYEQLPYEEWMKPLEVKLGIVFKRYTYDGLQDYIQTSSDPSVIEQVKNIAREHLKTRDTNIAYAWQDATNVEKMEEWKKIKRYHSNLFNIIKYTAL